MILAGHWSKTANPPEKPSECGNLAAQILRQKLAGFLSEIEEDSARFEHGDWHAAAAGSLAGDRRYAIIGLGHRLINRIQTLAAASLTRAR